MDITTLIEELNKHFTATCLELKLSPDIDVLKSFFDEHYEFLGAGRHRHTYRLTPDLVIKLPVSGRGWSYEYTDCAAANELEAQNYETLKHTNAYAECLLIRLSDIPLVVMEYIRRGCKRPPKWCKQIDFDNNGVQVGYDRKGKIKAFDYSHHLGH